LMQSNVKSLDACINYIFILLIISNFSRLML
jgi:hypothetical protein